MALRMWYRLPPAAWVEVDLVAQRVGEIKLAVSYSHPATLSWTMHQAQHTTPIPFLAAIAFTDDDLWDPDGAPLGVGPEFFVDPVFEGHVKDIQPAESNRLEYVAMDPTDRAGQELTILSGASSNIPRLVYNAMIETDDDYAFSRDLTATVSTMVQDLLGDRASQLRPLIAAPATGDPFHAPDLAGLDMVPQDKVVFETEGLRSGLDRLLQWYPAHRILFRPGADAARKWRVHKVDTAPQVTLTLNDWSTVGGKRILSMALQRSIEQRVAAVEILGPLRLNHGVASMFPATPAGIGPADATHSLTELWDPTDEASVLALGPDIGDTTKGRVFRVWQIAEPDARALARQMSTVRLFGYSDIGRGTNNDDQFRLTYQPNLLASYDGGVTYETVNGIELDTAEGIVRAPRTVIRNVGGAWVGPDNVVFEFGYFASELSARAPLVGFEGTANSQLGITRVLTQFDESLVVGYDKNDSFVDEAERIAQFRKLAQNILDAQKDIVYAGGCSLKGIDYDWLRLNRRVNFAAVDGDGDALMTGWEAVNAVLTDVEYDYSERLTTLTFSSDHMEFLLADPEMLRQRLKILALDTSQRIFIEHRLDGVLIGRSSNVSGSTLDFSKPST